MQFLRYKAIKDTSSLIIIKGNTKSLAVDLVTKRVVLVSNRVLKQFELAHNNINIMHDTYVKQTQSHQIVTTWLFLTMGCNLACKYCFGNCNSKVDGYLMNNSTIDLIFASILDASDKSTQRYEIVYFGGEPTLNYNAIEYAMHKFNNGLSKSVMHKIITNGVNFCYDYALKLIISGMGVIQITLDGCKEVHDARRMSKKRGGTFDTIMNNVKSVLTIQRDFTLIIRINVDRANVLTIKNFIKGEIDMLSDRRVFLDVGKVSALSLNDDYPDELSREEFSLHYSDIIASIYSYGLKAVPPFMGGCSKSNIASLFFSPKGKKFKCPSVVDDTVDSFNENLESAFFSEIDVGSVENKCKECKMLLLCGGGCSLEEKHSNSQYCPKKYMENDLVSYYSAKYREALSN